MLPGWVVPLFQPETLQGCEVLVLGGWVLSAGLGGLVENEDSKTRLSSSQGSRAAVQLGFSPHSHNQSTARKLFVGLEPLPPLEPAILFGPSK